MQARTIKRTFWAAAAVAAIITPWQSAEATTGYFSHGYGTASQGMAGVGTALPLDSQSAMRNPANMVDVGDRFDLGITFFSPSRDMTAEGGAVITPDKYKSSRTLFEIPDIGANWMVGEATALSFAVSGNGGMNTHYPTNIFNNFGGSTAPTGVDLMQAFVGVTLAHKFNDMHSVGITPTFAGQRFKAYGLEPFANFSIDPAHVSGTGYDFSYGGGVRVGYLGEFIEGLKFGVSYQTKMWMSKFDKYRGLFAEQGDFDIPAALQVGVSYAFPHGVTVGFDWERIFYSDVASIANTGSGSFAPNTLGTDDGPGFGWRDVDIFRLGAQWEVNQSLTLRAGASYNDQPFDGDEVLFNVLAPGVVSVHGSIGGTYNINEQHSISFAYTRAFSDSVTGTHPNLGGETLKLRMDQHAGAISYTFRW